MPTEAITALITAGATLLVCLVNNYIQMRNVREENSKAISMIDYKLSELTKQVEKHNNVVERTFRLEEQVKVANHRIGDLEENEKARN